jgi:hypothetical protein
LYVINKKNLDLNKDKDNYGKNSRVDIPKIRVLHLPISWIRKSRAIEILEKAQVSQDKSSRLE